MNPSAPSQGKGIHGAIKNLLEEQYAFVGGDRVQDMLIEDLIRIFQQYSRDPWHLEVRGKCRLFVKCRLEGIMASKVRYGCVSDHFQIASSHLLAIKVYCPNPHYPFPIFEWTALQIHVLFIKVWLQSKIAHRSL